MDLTPWRRSRDFRLLSVAGLISYLGAMMTYVAVPFQLYRLTGSNLAVGLIGASELVPLVVFGLYGGAVADRYDRRRVLVATGAAQCALTALLGVNAAAGAPRVWVIYTLGAALSAAQSLQRPSLEALLPQVVGHDEVPAAVALSSFASQVGLLAGPAIGGLLVAGPGASWAYGLDAGGIAAATGLYAALRHRGALASGPPPGLASVLDGLRYAVARRDLLGTYLVDLAAMLTAMPVTLFPAFADSVLRRPDLLGVMYSAGTAGALVATVTGRWTARVHRHGRAVVLAAAAWGAAVAVAGLVHPIWLVLAALMLAGAADMISAIFRAVIWSQTIPEERRGRLAGVEMLSYSIGPLGGQIRAGLVADAAGVRASIVGGGLLCVGAVAVAAGALRGFWGYDARTDEHAMAERVRRAAAVS